MLRFLKREVTGNVYATSARIEGKKNGVRLSGTRRKRVCVRLYWWGKKAFGRYRSKPPIAHAGRHRASGAVSKVRMVTTQMPAGYSTEDI